jgi:hypothetical protein
LFCLFFKASNIERLHNYRECVVGPGGVPCLSIFKDLICPTGLKSLSDT